MINGLTEQEWYPQTGKVAGDFFQTDASLAAEAATKEKQILFAKTGKPLTRTSSILIIASVPSKILALAASSDGSVYTSESGFTTRKLSLDTLTYGKTLSLFNGHTGPVTCLSLIYDESGAEESIITGSWDKTAIRWNLVVYFSKHTLIVRRGNRSWCIQATPILLKRC
jgi:WD40 repeat protein